MHACCRCTFFACWYYFINHQRAIIELNFQGCFHGRSYNLSIFCWRFLRIAREFDSCVVTPLHHFLYINFLKLYHNHCLWVTSWYLKTVNAHAHAYASRKLLPCTTSMWPQKHRLEMDPHRRRNKSRPQWIASFSFVIWSSIPRCYLLCLMCTSLAVGTL